MSADVICLRPEADFLEVGVQPPAGLAITYAEPLQVPPQDLATARAVVLASVGPRLERSWLDKIPDLELVQFTGAGVDRVGDACAHRPRVTVAGIAGANAREVAEYVLFAAGALLRKLAFADRGIRAGQYAGTRAQLTPRYARSLHSRTVGVVGLGQIGLAVAGLLRAVGATVCYTDPAPRDSSPGLDRLSLDDLLARCDVVTLHVPLLPSTRGMFGESQLRRMPPGALLINASRGGVVDEQALARVLTDGHLGGAAVDVYQAEPPAADSPLFTLPPTVAGRLLFTPHIAGVAYEAAQSLYTQAWDNVSRTLEA